MTSSEWISFLSLIATVLIAGLSLTLSTMSQRRQQARDDDQLKREDALRLAAQKREDDLRHRHREDSPRIEFGIGCEAHGEVAGERLLELTLSAHNKGLVDWKVTNILLRIRGIEAGQAFEYWENHEPRVEFPVALISGVEVVPPSLNFLFVEPGVRQTITYVTKAPVKVEYILVHVEFRYDEHTPHTSERVFRLNRGRAA